MEKQIFQFIIESDSIIISRHKNPDLDAYGAQFGLYYSLKTAFPNKDIYVIGDTNQLNQFQDFDEVTPEILSKSLLFILDTVSKQMLQNDDYAKAKKVILIDHHQNDPDISYDIYMKNVLASSTSEMVTLLLQHNDIQITKKAAKPLFMGIVGDTGRFMFSNTSALTFRVVADLVETGIDISAIFNKMYTETFQSKQVKADFFNSISLTKNKVAYRKNDIDFLNKHHMDSSSVSRGLVNQMAGIKEVPIWDNFTFDIQTSKIFCEFRSREIPVIEIAKKHGGGGHLLACGCSVTTWEDTDIILQELDELLEETNNG